MKELFEYISDRILTNVPEIKSVHLWNDQIVTTNVDRKGKAIRYPSCFIEFEVVDVNNLALGIKDYILNVRVRLAIEQYKYETLDTFTKWENLDATLQTMAPTAISGLTFTTFQEQLSEFDEDHDNVQVPFIEYRTRFRSDHSYTRKTDITSVTPKTAVVIPDVVEEI